MPRGIWIFLGGYGFGAMTGIAIVIQSLAH